MAKTYFLKWFHLYKENLTSDFEITKILTVGSNIKILNKVKMENTNQQKPSNISYNIEWSHTGNNKFLNLILKTRLPYMKATIHTKSIKLLKIAIYIHIMTQMQND